MSDETGIPQGDSPAESAPVDWEKRYKDTQELLREFCRMVGLYGYRHQRSSCSYPRRAQQGPGGGGGGSPVGWDQGPCCCSSGVQADDPGPRPQRLSRCRCLEGAQQASRRTIACECAGTYALSVAMRLRSSTHDSVSVMQSCGNCSNQHRRSPSCPAPRQLCWRPPARRTSATRCNARFWPLRSSKGLGPLSAAAGRVTTHRTWRHWAA